MSYRVKQFVTLFVFLTCVALAQSPVPGPNVNMVSGTTWPYGDPNLQKQNEPSIAVSTRNPMHLVAGANDYRTLDLAGLGLTGSIMQDAWLGLFKSLDGGQTWRSTLLPGCSYTAPPGVQNPCLGSPLYMSGYTAGADPMVRSGTNGMFFYSFVSFDRNDDKNGALAVARLIDDNNREGGDPIRYLDTSVIARNAVGRFVDKPFLAVDVPRQRAHTCSIPGPGTGSQTFRAGNVYVAYTIFYGAEQDPAFHSDLMVARSTDCGRTWKKRRVSGEVAASNQGAALAIDPATGRVYVFWRRFKKLDPSGRVLQTDTILAARSEHEEEGDDDDEFEFDDAHPIVPQILPFDQGTSTVSFRTNAYPTAAVVDGRAYVAWAQRGAGPGGDARIVIASSSDAEHWTSPVVVENSPLDRGHQIMPAMAYAGGKLMLLYYDLRQDHTKGLYIPQPGNVFNEMRSWMSVPPGSTGSPAPDTSATVFTDRISDFGLKVRHTMDVRVIQMKPPLVAGLTSTRVSQYRFGARRSSPGVIEQLQFNPPNLPLFRKGTVPFIGDYLDIAAQPFLPDRDGRWVYNTADSNSVVFHAAWTDNRNVRPVLDPAKYAPPGSPGGQSGIDPTKPRAVCVPGFSQPGAMNQDIFTSRIDQGLVVGAVTNAKPLGPTVQRGFSVVARNTGPACKSYRLTIENQPPGGQASFKQFAFLTALNVTVGARSGISRMVFVKSSDPKASVRVSVREIAASGCSPLLPPVPPLQTNGLQGTVVLNPDPQNPVIENLGANEVYNPEIENPEIENPEIENPEIENPEIENPEIENPEIENPDILNPEIENPEIENPEIENPEIENPEIENIPPGGVVTDVSWKVVNNGNTAATYNPKMLLNGPVPAGVNTQLVVSKFYTTLTAKAGDCGVKKQSQVVTLVNIPSPRFFSPADPSVPTPEIENAAVTNASFALAPGEQARITLRIVNPTPATFNAGQFFSTNSAPAVLPAAVNTGAPPNTSPLVITTISLPGGVAGQPYSATVQALGGAGARVWSLTSSVPGTLTIIPATGAITGAITAAGSYNVTVRVTDGVQSNSRVFTLVVAPPPLMIANRVFNTGVDDNHAVLPDGAVDPHYVLTYSTDITAPGPTVYTVDSTQYPLGPSPDWLPNTLVSHWVAPISNQNSWVTPWKAGATYTYRTTFYLSGIAPALAILPGRWAADDSAVLKLNGLTVSTISSGSSAMSSWHPFSITGGFVLGFNTLEAVVSNSGGGPSGLRIETSRTVLQQPVVTSNITVNSIPTGFTWTQNVSQLFELTLDLTSKTANLSIDGTRSGLTWPISLAGVVDLAYVSADVGTMTAQIFAWDDVKVTNNDGTLSILNANFNGDTIGSPPATPIGGSASNGTLSYTQTNGQVRVVATSADLWMKPVEIQKFGGASDVSLSLRVAGTTPTSGIWKVSWRSLRRDSSTGLCCSFSPVVVRDSTWNPLVSVEYR